MVACFFIAEKWSENLQVAVACGFFMCKWAHLVEQEAFFMRQGMSPIRMEDINRENEKLWME